MSFADFLAISTFCNPAGAFRWRTPCCFCGSTALRRPATTLQEAGPTCANTLRTDMELSSGQSFKVCLPNSIIRTKSSCLVARLGYSDVCIKFKKVFSHEQELYPPILLPHHLPSRVPARGRPPALPRGMEITPEMGVHPMCVWPS